MWLWAVYLTSLSLFSQLKSEDTSSQKMLAIIIQQVFKFYEAQKTKPSLSHSFLHLWHRA